MDDIVAQNTLLESLEDDFDNTQSEDSKRRVPPQLTVSDAVDILDAYKQRMIDQSYEQMLEDGEADVKTPLEVVDALEVLLYFVNTSFEMDEEI